MTLCTVAGRRPPAEWLTISDEVRDTLRAGGPVVALESTVIAHGLPAPHNLQVALEMEAQIRGCGSVPATIGICQGRATIGMSASEIERFASADGVSKASSRDLPSLLAAGADGATTVAGTVTLAQAAGIELLATGGIGGVHRGFERTADVSADLGAMARSSVAVVASGAKSILDLPRTLEYLETLGVAVVGYRTDVFPAFHYPDSGLKLSHRVDDIPAAARLVDAHCQLGMGGLLLAHPVPASAALERREVEVLIEDALAAAGHDCVEGKAVTPYLLNHLANASGGRTLATNRALLEANAALAGAIAARLAQQRASDSHFQR